MLYLDVHADPGFSYCFVGIYLKISGVKHPIHISCSVPTLIKDGILKKMDYIWSVYRVVPSAPHVLRHDVTSGFDKTFLFSSSSACLPTSVYWKVRGHRLVSIDVAQFFAIGLKLRMSLVAPTAENSHIQERQ
ncbi:hypothetical protein H5410_048937 [Solanum commersonii]|uniref:Uncharacterized protein n=1 Tax=Solanum commersonii TaxID=4109 RepID=A0A9J5XM20_SOLCO|nr:hypothetical protein H5410_048937 [Solanum commersonii]